MAEELVALNEAALAGRPFPPHRIQIEPMRSGVPDVSYREGTGRPPAGLEYILFGLELDIVFDSTGTSPSGEGGSLRVVAFLSRLGLKLVRIESRAPFSTTPLPQWLSGAKDFGSTVVSAAREGRLSQLLVGEAERRLIADDDLFASIQRKLPVEGELREFGNLIPKEGASGYRVDDMVLIARDGAGEMWGFEFDTDRKHGAVVLDSRPFVRVRKIEASRHRHP